MNKHVDPSCHRRFHRITVCCDGGTNGNLLVEVFMNIIDDVPTDLEYGGWIQPKDHRPCNLDV